MRKRTSDILHSKCLYCMTQMILQLFFGKAFYYGLGSVPRLLRLLERLTIKLKRFLTGKNLLESFYYVQIIQRDNKKVIMAPQPKNVSQISVVIIQQYKKTEREAFFQSTQVSTECSLRVSYAVELFCTAFFTTSFCLFKIVHLFFQKTFAQYFQ
jgi:hypothetical protein